MNLDDFELLELWGKVHRMRNDARWAKFLSVIAFSLGLAALVICIARAQ